MSKGSKLTGIYCDPETKDADGRLNCIYTTEICKSKQDVNLWRMMILDFGTHKKKCWTHTVRCKLTESEYKHFKDLEVKKK